ncbi:RNA polymerase II transcription factor B 52 kDa subunit, partial [Nowakowskiella sp. JEL0078]
MIFRNFLLPQIHNLSKAKMNAEEMTQKKKELEQIAEKLQLNLHSNVEEFMESLPITAFDRLYRQPATCLAILSRSIKILLNLGVLIQKAAIQPPHLITQSFRILQDSIKKLESLHVLNFNDFTHQWVLNQIYRINLNHALVGGGTIASFGEAPSTADKYAVDLNFLDNFATRSWEKVLHSLVSPGDKSVKEGGASRLLRKTGLLKEHMNEDLEITK